LTRKGLRELTELDRRSDAFAKSVLAPLSAAQRDRLIAAMAEIERLMRASAVQIKAEAPDSVFSRARRPLQNRIRPGKEHLRESR